jgi:hypothetical protein
VVGNKRAGDICVSGRRHQCVVAANQLRGLASLNSFYLASRCSRAKRTFIYSDENAPRRSTLSLHFTPEIKFTFQQIYQLLCKKQVLICSCKCVTIFQSHTVTFIESHLRVYKHVFLQFSFFTLIKIKY